LTSPESYSLRQRALALTAGVICHTAFAFAVGTMMWKLYTGLQGGPAFSFPVALFWDLLLILQFPLFHSLLLTSAGGKFLSRLTPFGVGAELRTTTFATVASVQLMLTFWAWAPLGPVLVEWHGALRGVTTGIYALGWVLLAVSMTDAGLGVQTGSLGWWAVFRNRRPQYGPWQERRTLRASRHPMYLAYTLLLWAGPVWSVDHLLLAGIWTLYCVLAPLHKESRYVKRYGAAFRDYQRRVPYFIPRLPSKRTSL
jgi:protein-S-isoprenylcysteine O-methyltransferase Ste14